MLVQSVQSTVNSNCPFGTNAELEGTPFCPERCLLLAIIDRALKDLRPEMQPHTRHLAIAWFEYVPMQEKKKKYKKVEEPPDERFTFLEIAELLEFSAKELRYIERKCAYAKQMNGLPREQIIDEAPHRRHRSWV